MVNIIFPDGTKLSDLLNTNGGTLTGDLILSKSNPLISIRATDASSPALDFRDSAGNTDGQVYTVTGNDMVVVANYGGLYLATAATTGGSIYLETKDVTRLTIADASITSTVSILPGTTDSYSLGSDTYWWYGTYTKFLKIDDTSTSIDDDTGNMKFTVATGKKFQFVVS